MKGVFLMAEKDVQDYLEKGLYGAPQLKPEEKKKFLGNFRERVILVITMKEMMEKNPLDTVKNVIEKYPDHQLYLNGDLDGALQAEYLKVAKQLNCPFRFVTTQGSTTEETTGLVYAASYAMHLENIQLADYQELTTPTEETPPPKKQSFWSKFGLSKK
ncbi:hypothetical protein CBF30_09940 [Vagococcus entomophilus]|uniref:DUF1694 domain-containing protein n=2 Tax=Vagococcus entomophilus TaxID=1160095 RepID=A0A430AFP0_9ENTE|nr:hypothetical protein CBF30_09940 [Vagococcus entomophilus]